jgi:hypothetical protein
VERRIAGQKKVASLFWGEVCACFSVCDLPLLKDWEEDEGSRLRRVAREQERGSMFTPVETSIGAILLHQATSNLLYQNGNILGVSGLLRQLFTAPTKETMAFFVGMAASYVPLKALAPQLITSYPPVPVTLQTALVTISFGALIGLGTKVSCCGESSGRPQS